MDFEKQLEVLKKSPEMNSHWYRQQYPDVSMLDISPAEHYLRFGALLGRNPGESFNTKYYLSTYPDVAEAGVNPLLHYTLHGISEERYRSPKSNTQDSLIERDILERLVPHLWGGHSQPALVELEKIYSNSLLNSNLRFIAALQSVQWYFFIADFKKVFEIAETISSLGENYIDHKLTNLIYSFFYLYKKNNTAAGEFLKKIRLNEPDDSNIFLALGNTLETDASRLIHINQIYQKHNLVPLKLKDSNKPLTLGNITATAAEINSPLKVSVIVPVFNSAEKLGIAIDSLLAQSWKNLEIIVVDDCSTDETYALAQQYSRKNNRVIALQHKKNSGAYVARNSGLAIATGDFITTHDGDDWSHPEKIQKQMEFLAENPDVMGVCTFWIRALNNITFTPTWRFNQNIIHWSHSSFLFHRKVVDEIGHWDSVIVGGDTEYIWRVEKKYGNQAVKHIMATIPMSIALDDEKSLTRSKATHVKTIHYGLRHIYRSSAKYWHKRNENLFISESNSRPFSVPRSILSRSSDPIQVDSLLVADFSVVRSCYLAHEKAMELYKSNKKIAIFHWPLFSKKYEDIGDTYFDILKNCEAESLTYDQEIICDCLWLAGDDLFIHIPEQLPSVTFKKVRFFEEQSMPHKIKDILEKTLASSGKPAGKK